MTQVHNNSGLIIICRFGLRARNSILFILLTLYFCSPSVSAQTPTPDLPIGRIVARSGDAYVAFDENKQTWEIGTDGIRRQMDYDANIGHRLVSLKNKLTNREWLAPGSGTSAELRMEIDGQEITGAASDFVWQDYTVKQQPNGALELQV